MWLFHLVQREKAKHQDSQWAGAPNQDVAISPPAWSARCCGSRTRAGIHTGDPFVFFDRRRWGRIWEFHAASYRLFWDSLTAVQQQLQTRRREGGSVCQQQEEGQFCPFWNVQVQKKALPVHVCSVPHPRPVPACVCLPPFSQKRPS